MSLAYILVICFALFSQSSQFEMLRPTSWRWRTSSYNHQHKSLSSAKRRISYDLGIGKNKPVTKKACSNVAPKKRLYQLADASIEQQKDVYQVAKFWCVHQTVHDIPNPLAIQAAAKKKPKGVTPLIPHRLADDFLAIYHDRTEQHSRATIMAKAPVNDFDLNTPWVEMLIHEQQVKAA